MFLKAFSACSVSSLKPVGLKGERKPDAMYTLPLQRILEIVVITYQWFRQKVLLF